MSVRVKSGAAIAVILCAAVLVAGQQTAPRILLDQSPRAVEYQLTRLSDDELSRVDRKDDDPRYRPIYVALLTRAGMSRAIRDEALAALVKLDKTTPARALLSALAKVPSDDAANGARLLTTLLTQPAEALAAQRDAFVKALDDQRTPFVLRGAYGALLVGDRTPERAWTLATAHDGDLVELLSAVPALPASPAFDDLRARLFAAITPLLASSSATPTRVAAVAALGWTRRDAATVQVLSREVSSDDADTRTAAIRALQVVPEAAWPASAIEPVARALVGLVRETPQERRTERATLDAAQLADRLAATLPDDTRRAVRRDLRSLTVQIVPVGTMPEQMNFDVRWFAVEAGKPVQIVLFNSDAMPHNVVITRPGTLRDVGTAAMSMSLSSDPSVKAYVPAMSAVMQATRLVKEGETEALTFTAPPPGEYPFACTFPGHFLRMYGVMLVVPDLDAWEAHPTVPTDPMTGQPFTSKRN